MSEFNSDTGEPDDKHRRLRRLAVLTAAGAIAAGAVSADRLDDPENYVPIHNAGESLLVAPGVSLNIQQSQINITREDLRGFQKNHWHKELFIYVAVPGYPLDYAPYINVTSQATAIIGGVDCRPESPEDAACLPLMPDEKGISTVVVQTDRPKWTWKNGGEMLKTHIQRKIYKINKTVTI